MGFLRALFGMWMGWMAIRIVRRLFNAKMVNGQENQQIKPDKKTLEVMPCPYCGVFTTTPCTNPDCPGMGIK